MVPKQEVQISCSYQVGILRWGLVWTKRIFKRTHQRYARNLKREAKKKDKDKDKDKEREIRRGLM